MSKWRLTFAIVSEQSEFSTVSNNNFVTRFNASRMSNVSITPNL